MTIKYDFVCSIGGNCMAAQNIQRRGLRPFSLPFDWLYMKDGDVLYKFADCFKNGFEKFCLRENMRFVPLSELPNTAHKDRVLYQDTETGWYFLNHFDKRLEVDFEFEKVKEKMTRRIERFKKLIEKSNRILFVLSNGFEVSEDSLLYLAKTLKEIYPDKEFFIKSIQFDSKNGLQKEEELKKFNVEIFRYERPLNLYDYVQTNYEWNFLDNIEINPDIIKDKKKEYRLFECHKLKRGMGVSFLPFINTLFLFQFYILGLRVQFSLGRNRVE